jgi:hypothetical protein
VSALAVGFALAAGTAAGAPVRFEETRLIIEYNSTDRDVGVQFFLDVDSWREVQIINPEGKVIYDAHARSNLLQDGGATEMFVEGNEPTLEDRPFSKFFERFPAGLYRFVGRTPEGRALAGEFRFSHRIPKGPELVTPVGRNGECAQGVPIPVVIAWNEVTHDIRDRPIDVESYEVIIESDDLNFDVTTSADTGTSLNIPVEVLKPGNEYGYEVLAIAANGNQTISASCFVTAR